MVLDRLLAICNYVLDVGREHADAYAREELARLVRINWFVQDLAGGSRIIKPVLLDLQQSGCVTLTGDTRLMALEMCPWVCAVPALISLQPHCLTGFDHWTHIVTEQHLTDLLALENGCVLLRDDAISHDSLGWIEFQSSQTAHHMHDDGERVRMMWCYLDDQGERFRFDRSWIRSQIDWNQYR